MTGQNTSSAVMQQRIEPHDSLDFFPTPPWVGRILCHELERLGLKDRVDCGRSVTCWEPAYGAGDLALGLADSFTGMLYSDIYPHPPRAGMRAPVIGDFLIDALWQEDDGPTGADWIITNPPFKVGPQFIQTAIRRAKVGVAMFVRTSFLEGGARLRNLFLPHPPALILQFSERAPLFKGKLRDPSQKYWDAKADKWRSPSSATSYCWIIWTHGANHLQFDWIPPCRRKFERAGDYPPPDLPPDAAAPDLLSFAPTQADQPQSQGDAS